MSGDIFHTPNEVWHGCGWHKCDEIIEQGELQMLMRSFIRDKNRDWRVYQIEAGQYPREVFSMTFCSFDCQESWRINHFQTRHQYLAEVEWLGPERKILSDAYIYRTAHGRDNTARPLMDPNGKPRETFKKL